MAAVKENAGKPSQKKMAAPARRRKTNHHHPDPAGRRGHQFTYVPFKGAARCA